MKWKGLFGLIVQDGLGSFLRPVVKQQSMTEDKREQKSAHGHETKNKEEEAAITQSPLGLVLSDL